MRPGGEVIQIDGQFFGQVHGLATAGGNGVGHLLARPAQHNFSKAARVFHAHAAMAVGAHHAIKQFPLGGIVHVDIMAVGEHELHLAQRIVIAGGLDDIERHAVGKLRPVDPVGGDDVALIVGNLEALLVEIARVAL